MKHHTPPHRPPWWPENESWPPQRGQFRRNPFFRRMGCMFVLFNLFILSIVFVVVGLIAETLGFVHFPFHAIRFIVPLGIIFVVAIVAVAFVAAYNLRRLSRPLDDLLAASNRVAEGDYSARIEEQGPPEARAVARTFNSMAERLQATDRQRRDMLADVTHELRTPLTVIRGEVEGMLDGVYPADESRLRSILDETQLMSRLVDDLRTLAMAEAGALQLRREPTDVAELILETVSAHRSVMEAQGVRIESSLAPAPSADVDPLRVREVLSNILTNALRHTPSGGQISVTYAGGEISVSDTGSGIAPEILPHIFERFYKSSDSGGMGLGLSIAKYLVEAHGGAIRAEHADGGGTRIVFGLGG